MRITLAQQGTNLLDWSPVFIKLPSGHCLTSAGGASRAMIGAEAIQQVLMPFVLLAAAIAIKLGQQLRVPLCNQIGFMGLTLEQLRIQRKTIRPGGRVG